MTVLGVLTIISITVIACLLPSDPVDTNENVDVKNNQEEINLARSEEDKEEINLARSEEDKEKKNKEKIKLVNLTATIHNRGCTDTIFDAYFVIDGKKVDKTIQTVKIPAGGQTDLKYNYIAEGTKEVSYSVSTDDILISSVSDFSKKEVFSTLGSNYGFFTVALISGFVFIVMLLVYMYSTGKLGKNKKRR